ECVPYAVLPTAIVGSIVDRNRNRHRAGCSPMRGRRAAPAIGGRPSGERAATERQPTGAAQCDRRPMSRIVAGARFRPSDWPAAENEGMPRLSDRFAGGREMDAVVARRPPCGDASHRVAAVAPSSASPAGGDSAIVLAMRSTPILVLAVFAAACGGSTKAP